MSKKPILILTVKLKGEIYDRVYSIKDLQHVLELFNNIHSTGMTVKIEEIQEKKIET